MIVTVMFSGGADSAYLLYYYLVHTPYMVHVHRVDLRYLSEPRWKEENAASERILQYCRENYRTFSASKSRYEFPFGAHVGWDSDLFCILGLRVAANMAHRYKNQRVKVAFAWTCDDARRVVTRDRIQRNVTGSIFKACHASLPDSYRNRIENRVEFILMEQGMDKKDIYLEMPEPLWQMSWSCRTPHKGRHCGHCHACRLRFSIEKKYRPAKPAYEPFI